MESEISVLDYFVHLSFKDRGFIFINTVAFLWFICIEIINPIIYLALSVFSIIYFLVFDTLWEA